ncbi:AAA family ATPase [Rhizobium sp. CBN3]|nr:AAA family ATPase [Rhizobium sp. CBN3]MDO3434129.1 AAA family ATPase [Rhizobium sp. CBN3]
MTQKPASRIVHLNGWPGTGKLTVGRLLARRLGARLIDNHTLLNPAEALFARSNPLHPSLREQIRRAFFDHAVLADPAESFVFTDALADDEHDGAMFSGYLDLAAARGADLVAVLLDCAPEENARRLISSGRSEALKRRIRRSCNSSGRTINCCADWLNTQSKLIRRTFRRSRRWPEFSRTSLTTAENPVSLLPKVRRNLPAD